MITFSTTEYDGSSPRARGTLGKYRLVNLVKRFIPACAGNTWPKATPASKNSVHPRVRGEHRQSMYRARSGGGSSPRARGTRRKGERFTRIFRFIPACAGNTQTPPHTAKNTAVHPRVRGEHPAINGDAPVNIGSSPRARGTHLSATIAGAARRFIPACAGNTPPAWWIPTSTKVHPRVRGEHFALSR